MDNHHPQTWRYVCVCQFTNFTGPKMSKSNRDVLRCAIPSVRACAFTPLWSIDTLTYCTYIAKIERLLVYFSVRVCMPYESWHTRSWGGALTSSTLFNTLRSICFYKQYQSIIRTPLLIQNEWVGVSKRLTGAICKHTSAYTYYF